MRHSNLLWFLAALALLPACTTPLDRRISAHQETWRGLSLEDQRRLAKEHVKAGDTEEMVRIALGDPDEVRAITSASGQNQTAWIYEVANSAPLNPALDPDYIPGMGSGKRSVILQGGVVVNQMPIAVKDTGSVPGFRVKTSAENMVRRLDAIVALAPGQRTKVRDILERANEKIFALPPNEVRPIRLRMQADIWALLTPKQQAKFDGNPERLFAALHGGR